MKYLFEKVENPKTMKESFIEAVEEVFFSNEHVAVVLGDIGHFGFKKIWESGKQEVQSIKIIGMESRSAQAAGRVLISKQGKKILV